MAAQNVPVPDTTPEEEFDLFGPGPNPGTAPAASGAAASPNPFVSEAPASPTAPQASGSPAGGVQAGGSPGGGGTVGEGDQTALLVGLLRQSLQQNQQMMQQNQQLVATMLRSMDLEEERRNKAEEKVAETAEAAKKAAEAALTRDPFDPRAAASSVDPGDKVPGSGFGGSNRAEKYLPPLPLIDHHVMGKGRMKEVEGWHTFLETLSSWLALQEEAFVRELKGDHEKKGKGRGDQTPKGARTPRGSEKGRGDKGNGDKGKEKGKDKWKKGPKGPKKHKKGKDKGRSLTEPESEEESGGGATLMALQFSAPAGGRPSPRLPEVPVLSPSEKLPSADVALKPAGLGPKGPAQREDPASESMGSLGTRFAKQGDVNHVCKALEATAGDVWLVDSGATCHIVSAQHLSGFRVVKKHERTANLFNASGGSIVVSGVVDLEVHFGDVFLRLEEVLVAEVGFNVISPWTASERGWKTFLAKGGSRLYKGNKKSIKLMGAQRAWWAVSGSKKNPKRQPKGAVPMEIDSISEGPKPGRCAGTALPGPASTGPKAPPGILKNRKKEAEDEIEAPGAQNPLSGTPFSFLFRGFVSEVSLSGPSEAPVFRDEAPEVREGPVEEPSDLRKDHVLEVVEHALPHEFSEVFLDCEFFPERPEAFRKPWHGVSKFELVRKLCSLNFGMLGLFGMFGMTLLLAAVFAFGAFYGKGNDGQLVAYGGEWRTECARAGDWCTECARAGEWCTECARAGEWSYECGRAGDWHDQCARGGWHNQCARGGWRNQCSRGGWRNQCARGGWCNQWARGVVSGSRWELRCPRWKPGNTAEYTIPWSRTLQSLSGCISEGFACSRSGFCSASGYSRRRCRGLGNLASAAFGGGRWSSRASWWCGPCGGSGDQTSKARPPEWEQGAAFSCACSRRGGRPPASTGFYGGAAATYSRSPFPGNTSSSSRGRATPDAQPLLWSAVFDRSHVRLVVVCNDGPCLSYKDLTWGWLAICPRRVFGDNRPEPARSPRRVPRRDTVPAATIAVVPRTRAAAAKADDRRRDHHRQRPRRVVGLASLSSTRTQPSRVGHPCLRSGDGNPVPFGGAPGGTFCYQRRPLEQCRPSWSTEAAAAGVSQCAGYAGIFEGSSSMCGQFRPSAHGLSKPPVWTCAPRFRKAVQQHGNGRGVLLEVHHRKHRCAGAAPGGRQAAQSQGRHGAYCYFPSDGEVRSSSSCPCFSRSWCRSCGSVAQRGPHNTGRRGKRCQQWIGFLRGFWGVWGKPAGRRRSGGGYRGYSCLPESGGVLVDPWCYLSSLRDARASSQGFPGSRQGDGRTGRSSPRGHRNRSYSSSRLYRHSGWSGSGAANSGDRAEIPTQPALSDLQTRAFDRENADDRGCRWKLGAGATRDPEEASAPSAASGAFFAKLSYSEPWPDSRGARVCSSEATACGCGFFRGPVPGLRKRSGSSPRCYRKRKPAALISLEQKNFEHAWHGFWHDGFEWHDFGMNVSLMCACFGSLGNFEAPQSPQTLNFIPSLLCLPSSRVRTPAMIIDVVAATLFAGLLFAWSLLSGIAFWWCSLVFLFFGKWFRKRGLRTRRFRVKCRRQESCFRMKLRDRWVRVWTQRQLVVVRREKVGCSVLLESMLRKWRLFWHVFLGMFGMFGMLVHVCERGNDEQPRPAKAEISEHRLRALHRGLPLPGAGTSADPLNLDPVDPYDPEGLLEPPAGLPEGRRPPPQPERIVDPVGYPEDPGDETEEMRVPLSSFSLHRHRCNGHFPFDENCMACCSSKGRVPARRLRRKLQRENQTVGLDFFYFGKLRVLLVMHLGSRYTLCLPAPELSDDLAFNLTRALKECGLSGKAVTFRLDNEASLVALVERTARHRACTASAVITDVVPGYRPQSKGSIEKQVDIMKSGFWAIWLDLEAQINQAQPSSDAPEGIKLPLGGLLWQACIFYTARCFNLWSTGPANSSVSLDRLHEEYVQKSRTRAFGSVCQARVARSKSHLQRYRGARTVKIVYLGPVHARGGGVYGVPLNGKDIDVFPAVAVGKEETTIDVPTLLGLAKEKPLALDDQDPERPTLFEPAEREEEGEGFSFRRS